ncbi:MAG: transglutaminase-like domain-containing protein [Lachnospiraceae bacterium]|nr:transglutaminase-like domain-containing protein [Lachnospiraceae bacterium]
MKILKRVMATLLMSALFIASCGARWQVKAVDSIDDNKNGTVKITFTNSEDTTVLILAENTTTGTNTQRYYYKLEKGKNEVSVPLTEGAGKYKIRICRVRSDGKAVVLQTKEVDLSESAFGTVFEIASMVINYNVKDSFIKKAESLTKGCKDDTSKIKKIYEYIYKNFAYDYELLNTKAKTSYYLPNNLSTYDRKLGICYDISCLMAAMLRSVGVEAKVVTGHTPNVKEYHAWNQVYDSNKKKWYTIDATYDMCLYNAKSTKKYTMIKNDADYSDIVYTY